MSLREEKKEQTRRAFMDAALTLMAGGRSFTSLSLREVAREVGLVPTAFYRHFRDMDELGLALVDETGLQLRRLMREARIHSAGDGSELAIQTSVATYLRYVRDNMPIFEFFVRERGGGSHVVRNAIAKEIRFFVSELASDLRYFPPFEAMPEDDLLMIADLVVNTVATLTGEMLTLPIGQSRREEELAVRAVKQLRVVLLGAMHWHPELGAVKWGGSRSV